MASGNHFVIDEFAGRAKMTLETFSRTHDYVARIYHIKIMHRLQVFFRRIARGVLAEPALRGSMAIFAGHAFHDFEFSPDQFRWRRERVAGETLRRVFGFAKTQNLRHAFAHVAGQRLVGSAVLVLDNPSGIFVLQDAAASHWFDAAVATSGGAGAGSDVF